MEKSVKILLLAGALAAAAATTSGLSLGGDTAAANQQLQPLQATTALGEGPTGRSMGIWQCAASYFCLLFCMGRAYPR